MQRSLPCAVSFVLLMLMAAPLAAAQGQPQFSPSAASWMEASYAIAFDGLESIGIDGEVDVLKITTSQGTFTARELRENYERVAQFSQAQADEFVAKMEQDILAEVERTVAEAFPTGTLVSSSAKVDRASLEAESTGPYSPPVSFTLAVTVSRDLSSLGIEDMTEEKVDAVFDAGARLKSDVRLFAKPGSLNHFTVHAPAGLAFASDDAAVRVAADGRSVSVDVDGRMATQPISRAASLRLYSPDAPQHDAEEASVTVVIDLKDVDVTVAKAAGGDFGNVLVDVTVEGRLGTLRVPDELRASVPSALEIEYVSADSIRMLLVAGVVSRSQLDTLEQKLLDTMRERLGDALGGGPVEVTGGFDDATLLSGSSSPIVFRTAASVAKPLAGGPAAPQAQAATSLYTVPMTFPLQRIEGYDTTYRVYLPKGFAVLEATSSDAKVTQGEEGGREYFEATPTGETAEVQTQIAVTPSFVIAKFWPVLLGAVVLLVLLVGGPTYAVVRARRKKRMS